LKLALCTTPSPVTVRLRRRESTAPLKRRWFAVSPTASRTSLRRRESTAPLKRLTPTNDTTPSLMSPSTRVDGPIEARDPPPTRRCWRGSPSTRVDGPIEACASSGRAATAVSRLRRLESTAPLKPLACDSITWVEARRLRRRESTAPLKQRRTRGARSRCR